MRLNTFSAPAMQSAVSSVRHTRFAGEGAGENPKSPAASADQSASQPDAETGKPAKKAKWYQFKLARPRDLLYLGVFAGLLGTVATAPHATQDIAVKVAAAFDPNGRDGSRLIVKADNRPDVAKTERAYVSADLKAIAHTQQWANEFSHYLKAMFPESEGAQAIITDFDKALAQYNEALAPFQAEVTRLNLTPETAQTLDLPRNDPKQTQLRTVFLRLHNTNDKNLPNVGSVAGRAIFGIQKQLADETVKVLNFWATHYDELFKPAADTPEARRDFEDGRQSITRMTGELSQAQARFARYGISTEDLLQGKLNTPQKPTFDEIHEILETALHTQIPRDMLKAELAKVDEVDALLAEINNPKPDSDPAALQEKLEAKKGFMMSDAYQILNRAKRTDPRAFFGQQYCAAAIGAFDPIADSTQANYERAEKALNQQVAENKAGIKFHPEAEQKLAMLPVLKHQVAIYAPITAYLDSKPYTDPAGAYLVPFRTAREHFRHLTNHGQAALDNTAKDTFWDMNNAITSGKEVLGDVVFDGRYLNNAQNTAEKADEVPLHGTFLNWMAAQGQRLLGDIGE